MTLTARLLTLLAVIFLTEACSHSTSPATEATAPRADASPSNGGLQLSPNRIVGRILAVDASRGFAFVNLASDPPPSALVDGAELIARTDDLRETARLSASRYARSHTLGTKIVSGQPSPGDEVVIHLP